MAFLIVMGMGVAMALIYVPLRLYLTLTARGRRLRLLQRIRLLRQELGPLTPSPSPHPPAAPDR
ncbi:MAG: hypothetical protein ACODUE_07670 [Synechococcus sp.]|jgi:hypothetical protein|nr:hypothetical protein [Synechococcus sp. Tobar2m-G35]